MLDIHVQDDQVRLTGRFDASQAEKARAVFDQLEHSCLVDFRHLEYISSAGMGVLLKAQKRLSESGQALTLTNLSKHIMDVFRYAGFDTVFEIVESS